AAGGAIPISSPVYFQFPQVRDAAAQGRLTGSAVTPDPLHRGTWVVDEERDEVALVFGDRPTERIPVGEWPELVVVDRHGRFYVSCRRAARIDIIEPDFSV